MSDRPGAANSEPSPAMALLKTNRTLLRIRTGSQVLLLGISVMVCGLGLVAAGGAALESDLTHVARTSHVEVAAPPAYPPQARGGFEQESRTTGRVQASAHPLARQQGELASRPLRDWRAFLLNTMIQIHWQMGRPPTDLPLADLAARDGSSRPEPAPWRTAASQDARLHIMPCRKSQHQCVSVPPPPAQPVEEPTSRRGPYLVV